MAQDKIIRIIADTTPIKNIRQEVQGLGKDLESLNREPVGPRNNVSPDLSELVNQYGKQPTNQPTIPRPVVEGSLARPVSEEPVREEGGDHPQEKERREEPITRPIVEESSDEEKSSEVQIPSIPRPSVEEKPSEARDSPIPRPIIEEPTETLQEEPVEEKPKKKKGRPKKPIETEESSSEDSDTTEGTEKKKSGDPGSQQLSILRQILKAVNDGNDLAVDRTLYLEELVSRREQDDDSNNIIPPVTPPILPRGENEESEEDENPPRRQQTRREEEDDDRSWSGRSNFTGIPGALVRGALQAAGSAVNSRNTFEAGASEVGAIGQTAGSLVSAGGSMLSEIPVVGGALAGIGELAGTAISGISTIVSSYAQRAVAKAEELENNTRSYSQITGVSSSEAKRTALNEGAYAARDLGMNAGEYLNRVTELRKAAGGKILGATEEDPNGVNEYQSQLAIQRSYGIDQGVLSQLQGSMRFSREGELESGGSTSPSGVIRVFENAMKELKLPFSEIAATLGESLVTFNRTTERILDKAGDFDAGKVATILANIRTTTGMEGRQLERVQTAITGGSISQDAVTQALLMRVGREVFPEADTLSALMEKIERIQEEPEYQKAFLKRLDEMTDNDEQLTQLMKAVYTNLSFGDIRSFINSNRGDTEYDRLFATPVDPNTAKGNEKEAQYDKSEGRRTVGVIEAATAEKTNRDAANGEKMLGVLSSIDSKVVQLATDTGLMEKTTSSINTALDALLKLALLVSEKDNPAWRDPKKQRDPNADWSFLSQGSLLMNLLKQMGLD